MSWDWKNMEKNRVQKWFVPISFRYLGGLESLEHWKCVGEVGLGYHFHSISQAYRLVCHVGLHRYTSESVDISGTHGGVHRHQVKIYGAVDFLRQMGCCCWGCWGCWSGYMWIPWTEGLNLSKFPPVTFQYASMQTSKETQCSGKACAFHLTQKGWIIIIMTQIFPRSNVFLLVQVNKVSMHAHHFV